MRRLCFAAILFFSAEAVCPQAVVSTHSGVLNYSEGEVFFDDQPVMQKPGVFPSVHEGSVLRTGKGRAEVLLNPGVFLRVDENSSFKMIASSLADTKVELVAGAVIVDSGDAAKTEGLTVLFRAYQIRFPQRGVYRINTEPGVLQPYSGTAEVAGDGPAATRVDDEHQYFLDLGLKTERYGEGMVDGFSEWARTRSDSISADNAAAQASAGDPGDLPTNIYAGALGVDPGLGGAQGFGVPAVGAPVYPSLSRSPLFLNGGLYPGAPYMGLPFGAYSMIPTLIVPVYGRHWPMPYPRPIYSGPIYPVRGYPVRGSYPPGLPTIVGGRRYPVTVQPVRPVTGVRPIAPRPVMPARPTGGIRAMGHR